VYYVVYQPVVNRMGVVNFLCVVVSEFRLIEHDVQNNWPEVVLVKNNNVTLTLQDDIIDKR